MESEPTSEPKRKFIIPEGNTEKLGNKKTGPMARASAQAYLRVWLQKYMHNQAAGSFY